MQRYTDVVMTDPFMRPYWRHERALRMFAPNGPKRMCRSDDPYIQEYKRFLFEMHKASPNHEKIARSNPGLYHAHNIHHRMQTDPEVGLTIEARLLAGFTYPQIAYAFKTIPETVEWYERLFFNVSDLLDHGDWIVRNVLVPASDSFALPQHQPQQNADTEAVVRTVQPIVVPYYDMSLKLFSYFGGPLVCDTMLSGFQKRQYVKKFEDLHEYFDEQFSFQIKRRSLQASTRFEINKYNVMELFALNSKLIEIQKSSQNKDDKHTAVEKNIFAMMNDFDWRVGLDGSKSFEGTVLGEMDKGKAELCAEEMMYLGVGVKPNLVKVNESTIYRTELVSDAKS